MINQLIQKNNSIGEIPIFFISFNRGKMLKKCIDGLKHLKTPNTIIIHDNGSYEEETVSLLKELENDGITIYRNQPIKSANELNKINETIDKYFKK